MRRYRVPGERVDGQQVEPRRRFALCVLYSTWTRTRGSAFSQVVRLATRRS
jgi:hypothetical protein